VVEDANQLKPSGLVQSVFVHAHPEVTHHGLARGVVALSRGNDPGQAQLCEGEVNQGSRSLGRIATTAQTRVDVVVQPDLRTVQAGRSGTSGLLIHGTELVERPIRRHETNNADQAAGPAQNERPIAVRRLPKLRQDDCVQRSVSNVTLGSRATPASVT
jgi:hypothetical protein